MLPPFFVSPLRFLLGTTAKARHHLRSFFIIYFFGPYCSAARSAIVNIGTPRATFIECELSQNEVNSGTCGGIWRKEVPT
jgi:hypothetical protein